MKKAMFAALVAANSALCSAQTGAPIKMAGSLDLSGPVAEVGKDTLLGIQFAVDALNKGGGVLGRQVAFEYQDNGSNAQRAITQATTLVRDGAAFLMAPQASGSTLGVTKMVSAKLKVPMCVSASGSEDITMKDFQPYVFSVTPNAYSEMRGAAMQLAKQPYKRYALLAADYSGARTNEARFKAALKELNPQAEIVIEEFPKLGAIDYTASINKILAAKPDYVFTILYGTDLVTFSKQATALGFFKQINGKFFGIYDESVLKTLGDSAAIGGNGVQRAPAEYLAKSSPQAKAYVDQFKAKNGFQPSDWSTLAYDCVMAWAQAVNTAKSTDADAVMRAVEASDFNTMRGKLRFGKLDHQADAPVYFGRIEQGKEQGHPIMAVTEVIPGSVVRPSDAVLRKSRQAD